MHKEKAKNGNVDRNEGIIEVMQDDKDVEIYVLMIKLLNSIMVIVKKDMNDVLVLSKVEDSIRYLLVAKIGKNSLVDEIVVHGSVDYIDVHVNDVLQIIAGMEIDNVNGVETIKLIQI